MSNKNGKLYIIVGRSSVGKSTIQKILGNYGFIEVVSCTTRSKRQNEIDGIDYHFISEDEFDIMKERNEFLESATYNDWHYAIHKDSIDLSKGNHVIVATPEGFIQLRDSLGEENVVGIYLYLTDYWELLKRSIDRQPHATVDQCKEMCRRFISDFDTFKDVEDIKGIVLKINNINATDTANIILRNIENNSI